MKLERLPDPEKLNRALAQADLRVLLMVLHHLTGDDKWISDPYLPKRDVALISDPNAGFDPRRRGEIREAAKEILERMPPPAIRDPGNEHMLRMMSVCLNERIPSEYAPMMREEVGFVSRFAEWRNADQAQKKLKARKFRVGIVGAGSAGIILASNFRKLGIPFTILEKRGDVGGTWRDHRYPGCSVDTPNHAYSFSFGARYAWSRYFAARPQIQDYLCGIADEMGIRARIRFNSTVQKANWDESKKRWRVEVSTPDGVEEMEFDVLVSAIGQLSEPYRLPIRGEESFSGSIFHPMHWPSDLDLVGKRVALIGTGASAMQIIPEIAPSVGKLTIYQRTPQWARPIARYHDPIDEDHQWLMRIAPFYAEWFRLTMLWRYGDGLLPTLWKDPDWPHKTRSVNATNERHRVEMVAYIEEKLRDRPDLVTKSIPNYPPYGKRILLDAGWYDAIRRPNVELVTDRIDRIENDAIVTIDEVKRAADVVIVSTGYNVNSMTSRLNVTGRSGKTLAQTWGADNPFAYLGCTVPDFPNLFIVYGPNTGLAHGGSAIFMNECASRYVGDFIVRMIEDDIETVEVKRECADRYTARVDERHDELVWTAPGLDSYYRNSQGRVTSACPWRLVDYWSMTHEADPENYIVTNLAPSLSKAG